MVHGGADLVDASISFPEQGTVAALRQKNNNKNNNDT